MSSTRSILPSFAHIEQTYSPQDPTLPQGAVEVDAVARNRLPSLSELGLSTQRPEQLPRPPTPPPSVPPDDDGTFLRSKRVHTGSEPEVSPMTFHTSAEYLRDQKLPAELLESMKTHILAEGRKQLEAQDQTATLCRCRWKPLYRACQRDLVNSENEMSSKAFNEAWCQAKQTLREEWNQIRIRKNEKPTPAETPESLLPAGSHK